MSKDDFWSSEIRELILFVEEFYRCESDRMISFYTGVRLISYYSANEFRDPVKMWDIISLPGDDELREKWKRDKLPTPEEIAEMDSWGVVADNVVDMDMIKQSAERI